MNRAHVLVVDDEPDILELVQYNLAAAGYDVTCAGSGEEALAAAGSSRPDLVILDVLLPGLDGLDVCKTLRGDARHRLSLQGALGAPIDLTQFPFCPNGIFAAVGHALQEGALAWAGRQLK